MLLERIPAAVGKGLFAGAFGTAAMTLSSTVEAKVRGRGGSQTPAEAICRLLGVETMGEEEKNRLTNLVHWTYGTSLAVLRGLIAVAGLRGPRAAAAFFGVVWAGELLALPAISVSPPATEWGKEEIAIDATHHFVYALATSLAYEFLNRER
ncbi:MAG: hypothetical protein M3O70_11410 [Actinomycetota bacterium]|nr:hypothetical protein [Actinomycetota bacterium]